jgi:hypothetical protein
VQAMRQAPLLALLEMICKGITSPVPALLLARVTLDAKRQRFLEMGEVFKSGESNRWSLLHAELLHPVQVSWTCSTDGIVLEWSSSAPLPPILSCPLYSESGWALWDLYAVGFAMKGLWDISGHTPQNAVLEHWHAVDVSLLDFWWRHQREGRRCGWSFSLPPCAGTNPKSARLHLRFCTDHPLYALAGRAAIIDDFARLTIQPVVELNAHEGNKFGSTDAGLSACDPNTQVRMLEPLAEGSERIVLTNRDDTCVWLTNWVRWILNGRRSQAIQDLLPTLQMLEWQGVRDQNMVFTLSSWVHTQGAWSRIGREIACLQELLRQATWLSGSSWQGTFVIQGKNR